MDAQLAITRSRLAPKTRGQGISRHRKSIYPLGSGDERLRWLLNIGTMPREYDFLTLAGMDFEVVFGCPKLNVAEFLSYGVDHCRTKQHVVIVRVLHHLVFRMVQTKIVGKGNIRYWLDARALND